MTPQSLRALGRQALPVGGWLLAASLTIIGATLALLTALGTPSGSQPATSRPVEGEPSGATRSADAARPSGDDLTVHLRLPERLLPGNVQRVPIEVTAGLGRSLADDLLLEIRVRPELEERFQGAVWVTPPAQLMTVAELRHRPLQLHSTISLPCDVRFGALLVEVRTLAEDGRQGAVRVGLPAVPCNLPEVPTAPPSVHLTTPVCGDDWREDVELLTDGQRPAAAWCRPQTPDDRKAPSPSTTERSDPGPTQPEPSEPPEVEAPDPEPEPPAPEPAEPAEPSPAPPPEEPAPRPDPADGEEGEDPTPTPGADGEAARGRTGQSNGAVDTNGAEDPPASGTEGP